MSAGPSMAGAGAAVPSARLLPGKVVVITGASQGIGRAVAIGESRLAAAASEDTPGSGRGLGAVHRAAGRR